MARFGCSSNGPAPRTRASGSMNTMPGGSPPFVGVQTASHSRLSSQQPGLARLASRNWSPRLADRLGLLTGGRRTALPRQRTLRATLDWSYDLLTEAERLIFRRLSVFAGGFTTEAARSVALSPEVAESGVVDCVLNLVAKSLVAVDFGGPIARYRLLGTTRTYALEKLAESGERSGIARRHAEYFRDCFSRRKPNPRRGPRPTG